MLGDILKDLRTKKGSTQSEIAKLLKIKRQTYSAYERNISYPDIKALLMLAAYFNVNLYYLLEEEIKASEPKGKQIDTDDKSESSGVLYEAMGERIKKLRMHSELTQMELADILGIKGTVVAQYERGESIPSGDVIIKIADFFGVSLDYIFGRIKEQPKQNKENEYLSMEQQAILNLCLELPSTDVSKVLEYAELLQLKYKQK